MSKIKNGGLDQYGAEPFEQQRYGTVGVEGVNVEIIMDILAYPRPAKDDSFSSRRTVIAPT